MNLHAKQRSTSLKSTSVTHPCCGVGANQGFTLVELIIYIAIFAVILVLITGFFWSIIFGNIKESSLREVQQNGRFALTKITREIKKAAGINIALGSLLSLEMAEPTLNPTVFDVADGKLRITQGSSSSYELTTDQVIVSSLQFTDLSYPGTSGTIRIEVQLEYINPSSRPERQASINLESTVSLLPGGAAP